ncbi:MAG TPA: HAMP domain-containing sensor histidine kinase [Vicinamibacteria bacterium]|nr:HAMP domain-containing sensor histidine kinase [Vicinamibacteria bacterium]
MSIPRTKATKASRTHLLRRIADQVLEAPDIEGLTRLLTHALPSAVEVEGATLLLWDRKLESVEALSLPEGETQLRAWRPETNSLPAPETHYLLSDGQMIETPARTGMGTLVPLIARSGAVGTLILGRPSRRRKSPLSRPEARLVSVIASRSALALENHLYQKELIASERLAALGTLAGMLAHDFRGPMTVIRGYAETLLDPGLPADEVRARADLIVQNIDRLERMTGETLDFARGGGRVARRSVFLPAFLQELAAGLASELPGLEVVRDFDVPAGTSATLDVDKLRRAVGNIAANALDAMGGRGRFHLAARVVPEEAGAPARLVLTLADEGPGVAEEVRDRLFRPFATFGKKKGTGLGLAVARRFVEDHGGTIELLPTGPAPAGACFRIRLPLVAIEAGAARGAV